MQLGGECSFSEDDVYVFALGVPELVVYHMANLLLMNLYVKVTFPH